MRVNRLMYTIPIEEGPAPVAEWSDSEALQLTPCCLLPLPGIEFGLTHIQILLMTLG